MSKLTTVFEDYNDSQLIVFCIDALTNGCHWDTCITIDDSTGDIANQRCKVRFEELVDWFYEFYGLDPNSELDLDRLYAGALVDDDPDSRTSAYETETGTLILVQSHPL